MNEFFKNFGIGALVFLAGFATGIGCVLFYQRRTARDGRNSSLEEHASSPSHTQATTEEIAAALKKESDEALAAHFNRKKDI